MSAPLQLLSLGPPLLVTERGEAIHVRRRKPFALLIRMAVERQHHFSRDYLMDLLWPNVPARRARHSLAQALSAVRTLTGRQCFYSLRASVELADGAVATDLARMDQGDVQIRGPFLEGFHVPDAPSFEHWKDECRAKVTPRMRDCLLAQVDARRRVGDFAAVERHARVLLAVDPFSEDAALALMEARVWAGDRSGALRVYEQFRARLATELAIQPSNELARVAGLLQRGQRSARVAASGKVSERRERRFEAETLIGREREFGQLYDAWVEARHGIPRVFVLLGEPGVGKTTLVNAFVSTCQMAGAVVARAQAYDAERELPFAVLAELVKQLASQRALGAMDPEALSELVRVSPEIAKIFPGVPEPAKWSAEVIPLRLADAFLKAIAAATDDAPLVLVVDDLHAADNASMAILHVAARKLPSCRFLLILTARASELSAAAAPPSLVSDTAIGALRTLDLEPLADDAAARVVSALAAQGGGRIADLPVGRILRASNGNPLALELLTKEWLTHGAASLLSDLEALNTQPAATLGIPRAIALVFESHIRRLDRQTRAALDLAAVLGRRLSALPLYGVVGLSPAGAGEAVSRLREEGFLREIHGSLEFRNELVRAQAYYALAAPTRQHLHRSVAQVLAAHADADTSISPIEIAWHFLRADNPSEAILHGVAGAERVLRVGAPYEAERMLEALLQHKLLPDRSKVHVSLLLAKALLDQSKAETALRTLDALVRAEDLPARDFADVTRMRATAIYLVNEDSGRGPVEAANEALAAAMHASDPELIARALFEYARSGVASGNEERVRRARRFIDEQLRDAKTARIPVLHYAHGFCDYFLFEPHAAATSLDLARQLLSATQNITELSFIYNGLGNCKYHLCEFESAREFYLSGLRLASKVGDDSRGSIISANLCGALTTLGEYREAVCFGEQSLALGNRALNQPTLVTAFTSLAEAYILAGMTEKALACLEGARAWVQRRRSWTASIEYLCQSACVALMMGNLSHALDLIGQAEQAARGRERSVSVAGVFAKLRILRAAHVEGIETALRISNEAKSRFRGRHPLYYLMVLAAASWVEKRALGRYSPDTEAELTALKAPNLAGLRAVQAAQGIPT